MIEITMDFICDRCNVRKTIATAEEFHLSMFGNLTIQDSFFKRAGLKGWVVVATDKRIYCPDCAKEKMGE